jgi:cytochrome b involved in lipid metabolism
MMKVTQEALEQHTGADGSYWTVIHGTVYDFTSFVDEHPGGAAIVQLAGGRCVCLSKRTLP